MDMDTEVLRNESMYRNNPQPLMLREDITLGGAAESFLAEPQVEDYNITLVDHALKVRDGKLGNPEVVEKRIEEYFKLCHNNAQLPSIKALGLYIGVPYATLKTYLNDPTSRYYDMLSRAKDLCHVILENGALNNKVNPATYMFTAANFYDMKDTKSVEIGRSATEKELAASRESIDALKNLLKKERGDSVTVDAEYVEVGDNGA
jgi:protein involved in temperature-dependent protein secretion